MKKFKEMPLYKRSFVYIIFTVFALAFFGPFLIMMLGSFREMKQFFFDPAFWIPDHLSLANYEYIFTRGPFLKWLFNSTIITVIPVLSQIFVCTILGYVFAKKAFKGREVIFWMLMATVMIPKQLLIIPNYILFGWFDWINTLYPLIVPELWGIMGVFLVRQFMQSIPKELEEAAYMDGAGDFQIFFKVIVPLSVPAMAVVGTFAFIGNWNDFFTPLIFTTSEDVYPLTVGLASLLDREGNFGVEMAAATVSFIPSFVIFLFFQKYFTEGISLSGLK